MPSVLTHLSHSPGQGTAEEFMVNSIPAGNHYHCSPQAYKDRDLFNLWLYWRIKAGMQINSFAHIFEW